MNKYLRSFKSINYKRKNFTIFSFSTLNQNTFNTKRFQNTLDSITEPLNLEKENQVKALFQNIEADNYELTNKVKVIMDSKVSEEIKIINIVNEINNVNIKNSEKLLSIHQNYVFNYTYNFIAIILSSLEKILKVFSPKTLFSLLGIYFAYKFVKTNYLINKKVDAKDVVKFYRENGEKLFKSDTLIPIFVDHKNISNLIVNGKQFLLIGPKGIGKTYSIKHFCMLESQKDSIVIYKDLNNVDRIENIYEFICSSIVQFYIKENKSEVNLKFKEILELIKGRKAYFVLDHFSTNPKMINTYRKVIEVLRSYNFNIIVISDNNKHTDFALEENFDTKNVDEKLEEKFNNYLLENINHLMKSNTQYSNCELFSEKNIKDLRNTYHISFKFITEYLNNNSSIKEFSNLQNEKILQKLKLLQSKNPEIINSLKEAFKLQKKPQEWIKIKDIKHYNSLLALEKKDLISIRNIDEIRILNPITKELLNKI